MTLVLPESYQLIKLFGCELCSHEHGLVIQAANPSIPSISPSHVLGNEHSNGATVVWKVTVWTWGWTTRAEFLLLLPSFFLQVLGKEGAGSGQEVLSCLCCSGEEINSF